MDTGEGVETFGVGVFVERVEILSVATMSGLDRLIKMILQT